MREVFKLRGYALYMEDALVVFQDRKIRRVWFDNEWWFVLEDIVQALADSNDPKQYIQKMKQRDAPLSEGWVQLVHILPVQTRRFLSSSSISAVASGG